MKQVIFRSRLSFGSPAPEEDGCACPGGAPQPDALPGRIKAARIRHSACGVSSLFVHRGGRLLAVLEGGRSYVDRMLAALAQDGLLEDLEILSEHPIHQREFSHVALRLVDAATLEPRPVWAATPLAELDLRSARRILKSLRAAHGLHAQPARESFLRSVQVGRLRA